MNAIASDRLSKCRSTSPAGSAVRCARSRSVVTDSIRYATSIVTGIFTIPAAASASRRMLRGSHTSKSQRP